MKKPTTSNSIHDPKIFIKDQERVDPMAKVFPKVSKCTFHKYGPSGTIVNHDGLCILPINIINEKENYKQ